MLPVLMAVQDCENLCGRTVSNEKRLPDRTTADSAYLAPECLPRSTDAEQQFPPPTAEKLTVIITDKTTTIL